MGAPAASCPFGPRQLCWDAGWAAPEVLGDGALHAMPQLEAACDKARHNDHGVLGRHSTLAQLTAGARRVILAEHRRQAHAVRQLELGHIDVQQLQPMHKRLHQRLELPLYGLALHTKDAVKKGSGGVGHDTEQRERES